jgi:glutamate---cysteine ligase / carboxylate-amine ligase
MGREKILSIFAAYGIELEYMIVEEHTLKPLPICDRVLFELAKKKTMSLSMGEVAWSNELALHVIELKANGPKSDLPSLHRHMVSAVNAMNAHLKKHKAFLLPTAMHPYFDPHDGSLKLWHDEDAVIYATFDRIFGCGGHGWGNLQSTHINLPFNGDEEFARLHSAIRLMLPLLPALAASSPYVEGKAGPYIDSRLHYYLANQRKIAAIIGDGIPEPVTSKKEYEERILKPMYKAIAPYDPEGTLQHEWLNSRAAIARFERNAIEIRILDIQECISGDFALISAIVSALKKLCGGPGADLSRQLAISQASLVEVLHGALHQGLDFTIKDAEYLKALGAKGNTIREVCSSWTPEFPAFRDNYQYLLKRGNLGQTLVRECGSSPSREQLCKTYSQLATCLAEDKFFRSSVNP